MARDVFAGGYYGDESNPGYGKKNTAGAQNTGTTSQAHEPIGWNIGAYGQDSGLGQEGSTESSDYYSGVFEQGVFPEAHLPENWQWDIPGNEKNRPGAYHPGTNDATGAIPGAIPDILPQGTGGQAPDQSYIDLMTQEIGTDPMSQATDASLIEGLGGGGPLTEQAAWGTSHIAANRGDTGSFHPRSTGGRAAESASEAIIRGRYDPTRAAGALYDETGDATGDIIDAEGVMEAHGLATPLESNIAELLGRGRDVSREPWSEEVGESLSDIIANQGRLPYDPSAAAVEIAAARSPLDAMRRAQTAQGGAALADRGLVGSGVGRDYLEGLEERLAPLYARAGLELEIERRQAERQRFQHALDLQAQLTAGRQELGFAQEELALGAGAGRASERERQAQANLNNAYDRGLSMGTEVLRLNHEGLMQQIALERGISVEEAKQYDGNLFNAIANLLGIDRQTFSIMLDAAGSATDRQRSYVDAAATALEGNQRWLQYLNQTGMSRADFFRVAEQEGVDGLLASVDLWARTIGQTSGGYRGSRQD